MLLPVSRMVVGGAGFVMDASVGKSSSASCSLVFMTISHGIALFPLITYCIDCVLPIIFSTPKCDSSS